MQAAQEEEPCPYLTHTLWSSGFGFSIAGGGDVDDDGLRDLLIGSPGFIWEECVGVYSARTGKRLLDLDRGDEDTAGSTNERPR